jgi:dipeptidyl aminopeptidase/acylaminoacyl peptidase
MNGTDIREARLAPDGAAAVIATSAPDWQRNRFREDLWLWREATGTTIPLTRTGHDNSPQWSPSGRLIAFISDRVLPEDSGGSDDGSGRKHAEDEGASRLWLIDPNDGEAFPAYREKMDVHSFAWSADGSTLYFSTQAPLPKSKKESDKAEWKDVIRWREQERGDVLLRVAAGDVARESQVNLPPHYKATQIADSAVSYPRGCSLVSQSDDEIDQIAPNPDGSQVAFHTQPVSHRLERPEDYEIYIAPAQGGPPRELTHNTALENGLRWSPDGKRIYFRVGAAGGSLDGRYHDVQGRLYVLDPGTGKIERLGEDFQGSWESYDVLPDGSLLAVGLSGIEAQVYSVSGANSSKITGIPGTYGGVSVLLHGPRLLMTHSAIDQPTEVYLAEDPRHLADARPITQFNQLFTQRALPQWKPYKWTADDGTSIEGVLLYPPGKLGARKLRMLTLIHGGPGDADGNRFGADWYDWAGLAAANGWLVFRPNYRGSSGYGDQFMLQISPHLVSRPGKDILAGVDALVKDGIADPQHLAIGGYSYGGYMTNWLITQTTRFRSAVTGAGAVEHAANWGNDDLTYDDAWYLSGTPWERPDLYQAEAALFQFNKVKTPTHAVAGNADVRVSYLEGVLLERALERLDIPHTLLVFPGEGHPLDKNPWHGYIKVREELKWLEHYDSGT